MLKTLVLHSFRGLRRNIPLRTSSNSQALRVICSNTQIKVSEKFDEKSNEPNDFRKIFITASLWSILTKKDDEEETPEDKLIMNIKRGILSIQRGEYKKAEQMLHLALKMAQDLQHSEGITYIYDVLANLALEAGDFKKAEELFVAVMQRLFGEGYKEDSTKMLHLSAKMAHLKHFKGELENAVQGFVWTLEKLEAKVKQFPDDTDLYELFGLAKNWYAMCLMDTAVFTEARKHFTEAYEIYTKIHGEKTEEAVMMLNSLSVVCTEMKDFPEAIKYIKRAIQLAEEIPKMTEVGIFHANLGLLYLKQGLSNEARNSCKFGRRLGLQLHNEDAVKLADDCINKLNEIKDG